MSQSADFQDRAVECIANQTAGAHRDLWIKLALAWRGLADEPAATAPPPAEPKPAVTHH